MVIERSKVLFC